MLKTSALAVPFKFRISELDQIELKLKQLAQALGLLAADRHFGLFFIVHFQHESGFEPRYHFLDVM